MSTQPNTPQTNTANEDIPVIPPIVLLGIALVSFVIALFVGFTQPEFGAVGFGAIGIGIVSLVVWVLMNPSEVIDTLRGRSVSYGGTAIIFTILAIVASSVLYALVAQQNWQRDFSDSGFFSLNEATEEVVRSLAADPTTPQVHIIGFYTVDAAAARDQVSVLLSDFADKSAGKISFEFVDPNRSPGMLEVYGANNRQLVVMPVDAETGEPDADNAEVVLASGAALQQAIAEAVITVSATGDFRAYFVDVANGIDIEDATETGGAVFVEDLRERFGWTVESINLLQMASDNPPVELNDPAADGDVLVIAGGTDPIPDDLLRIITDYVDDGGNLVILGASNFEGGTPTAAADNLNNYLSEQFGIRVLNNYVFDEFASTQFGLLLNDFGEHPIMQGLSDDNGLLFDVGSHSIEIVETDSNVEASVLVRTTENGYAKTDLDFTQQLTEADLAQDPDDLAGTLGLGIAVENTDTGGRVVVFGNAALIYNSVRQFTNVLNHEVLRRAIFWTVDFENFAGALANLPTLNNPADAPIVITDQNTRNVVFISVIALPFGVLFAGIFIWWARREKQSLA